MKKIVSILFISVVLTGCSAKSMVSGAERVRLSPNEPSQSCTFIAEVYGSQGNSFTGDFTSNKALMEGARNDLRNKAFKLGANFVHLHNTSNASAWGSLGTTNTTVVGDAYHCY